MSYGTETADRFREAGIYSGKIIEGTKPADRRRRCGGHVAVHGLDKYLNLLACGGVALGSQ